MNKGWNRSVLVVLEALIWSLKSCITVVKTSLERAKEGAIIDRAQEGSKT